MSISIDINNGDDLVRMEFRYNCLLLQIHEQTVTPAIHMELRVTNGKRGVPEATHTNDAADAVLIMSVAMLHSMVRSIS